MSVKMEITYDGSLRCTAKHGPSGALLITDAPLDNGGAGNAFSPTDLVATALGTCILTIMGLIAKRDGFDITGTRLSIDKEMSKSSPRRIGDLNIRIEFPQDLGLTDEQRMKLERSIDSCPVKKSLHPEISVSIEILQG